MERLSMSKNRKKINKSNQEYVPRRELFLNCNDSSSLFGNKSQDFNQGDTFGDNDQKNSPPQIQSKSAMKANPVNNDLQSVTEKPKSENLVLPDAFLTSKQKPQMLEYVQIESPSKKFQAKLMEREK